MRYNWILSSQYSSSTTDRVCNPSRLGSELASYKYTKSKSLADFTPATLVNEDFEKIEPRHRRNCDQQDDLHTSRIRNQAFNQV